MKRASSPKLEAEPWLSLRLRAEVVISELEGREPDAAGLVAVRQADWFAYRALIRRTNGYNLESATLARRLCESADETLQADLVAYKQRLDAVIESPDTAGDHVAPTFADRTLGLAEFFRSLREQLATSSSRAA